MPSLSLYAFFALLFFKFTVPLAVAAPDATSALSFAASKWIWASTTTVNGLVALRKDFTPPLGKSLIAGEINRSLTKCFAILWTCLYFSPFIQCPFVILSQSSGDHPLSISQQKTVHCSYCSLRRSETAA
ncbi:hypothetical protein B0H13DRAFT_2347406 [Mycena leptocephala]|nr:hypothetical protein B0H13DRAFT_2347406 [Mycena leptocephala]